MHPSRQYCLWASLAALLWVLAPSRTQADAFTITSTPPGATVEIDGIVVGVTPYHVSYPSGYFRKPHTLFNSRLEHSMTLRISKSGYGSQQLNLTEGPFEWIAITGRHEGNYFLLKSSHFDVHLDVAASASHTIQDHPAANVSHSQETSLAHTSTGVSGSTAGSTGSVAIESEPSGAEIYADGSFVGQTPSTIRLAEGSHHIELRLEEKQPWVRELDLASGSQISLHANMESPSTDRTDHAESANGTDVAADKTH